MEFLWFMRLDVNIYMSRENVRRGGPHLWTDAQPPRYQAHSIHESHYTTDKSDTHNRYRFVNCFTNPWRNSYYWNIGDCWLRSGKAGFNTIWFELLYTSHTFISFLMNQAVFFKYKKVIIAGLFIH